MWDYALTALTDGTKSVPATTQYQAQSGGLLGTFLAQYTAPSGADSDVGVRVLLSSAGEIQSVTTVDVTTGSSAGVSLQVGRHAHAVRLRAELERLPAVLVEPVDQGHRRSCRSTSCGCRPSTQFDMALVVGDAAGNADASSVSARVQ